MLSKHLLPIEEYKEPIMFADEQLKVVWLPEEVKVEKDIQDVLVNFSEAEKHGTISSLKLFSLYETHAGDEYWGGRFKTMFDGAEFHRMASVFSMFELAIHAPFYKKINDLLHLNTPEFFLSYQDVTVLKERMEHINTIINDSDDCVSLGGFSMIEGAVLYTNFAYLKHFQALGKNKALNLVRGINFSVRDENLHAVAGAWCYRLKMRDKTEEEREAIESKLRECAQRILDHELEIIDITFEKGEPEGITKLQMVNFFKSRLNLCLKELGMEKMFEVKYNPISDWFYKAINDFSFNDNFSGIGNQYHRNWDETAFVFLTDDEINEQYGAK